MAKRFHTCLTTCIIILTLMFQLSSLAAFVVLKNTSILPIASINLQTESTRKNYPLAYTDRPTYTRPQFGTQDSYFDDINDYAAYSKSNRNTYSTRNQKIITKSNHFHQLNPITEKNINPIEESD